MSERRLVYSTGGGQACPGCGWPVASCRCSAGSREGAEEVPARPEARLRIEKKGRGGKTVTVIDGLPRNDAFLAGLARDLKRACGAGGTVGEGAVEIQGDVRERVRALLAARGFLVKG